MTEIATYPAPTAPPLATKVELVDFHEHRGVTYVAGVRTVDPTMSFIKGIALDDLGNPVPFEYLGAAADGLILFLNKANLTGAGLSKNARVLARLVTDGKLIVGTTVSGVAD